MKHEMNNQTVGPKRLRIGALSSAKFLANLYIGPSTVRELMEATGFSKNTVYAYLRALKAQEVIHISAWERDDTGRFNVPTYSFGVGKDAAKPKVSDLQKRQSISASRRLNRLIGSFTSIQTKTNHDE